MSTSLVVQPIVNEKLVNLYHWRNEIMLLRDMINNSLMVYVVCITFSLLSLRYVGIQLYCLLSIPAVSFPSKYLQYARVTR